MQQTDVQWTKVDAQFAQWPLRYSLPLKDFTRTIWVSDSARQAWEPRLIRTAQVWRRIEVESVRHGRRAAALVALKPDEPKPRIEDWQHIGLDVRLIATMPKSSGQSDTVRGRSVGDLASPQVAVGAKASVARLARACDSGDVAAIGRELGYPECCCRFFETTRVQGQWQDSTWPMAMASQGPPSSNVLSTDDTGPLYTNIMWTRMGLRACPHFPCRADCEATISLSRALIALGRELGFDREMEDLSEILSWPVEWSALHGIAEIRTPILKIATRTDATETTLRVRRMGSSYPAEGANGTRFPFNMKLPTGRARLESKMKSPARKNRPETASPDDEAQHNGFTSAATMQAAHAALVLEARARLRLIDRAVIDLGCGTGALLRKIIDGTHVVPYGIDQSTTAIEIAQLTLPRFSIYFQVGDMFEDSRIWFRDYRLALLGARRLLEVPKQRAEALLSQIKSHAEQMLVYAYPERTGDLDIAELGRSFHLRFEVAPQRTPHVQWAWVEHRA